MLQKENTLFLPLKIHTWTCLTVSKWDFELKLPFWRFYHNFDSGAEMRHHGQRIEMESDKVYLVAPYAKLRTDCTRPFRHFYIHFSLEWRLGSVSDAVFILRREQFPQELLNSVAHPCPTPDRNDLMGVYAVVTNALFLIRNALPGEGREIDSRIEALLQKLDKEEQWLCTNRELAKLVYMSENAFIRLFTTNVGVSPQHYLRNLRVEKACRMLHFTSDTIDEIAEKTGFANRYHFSRVFSQVIGACPAAFRDSKTPWQAAQRRRRHQGKSPVLTKMDTID